MLTKKQIVEIREHLDSSQNPLFFFDNDADGLCSFLLLRRYIERGNGVVVKSYPGLNESYIRKIKEFNPDKIFVLDKPLISEEFLDYLRKINLPCIWIDHHEIQNPKGVFYYNPLANGRENEPVSYLCYKITQRDEWVSMIGCIGDYYLPDFIGKFMDKFPGLIIKHKTAAEVRYESEMGKLTRIIEFALKDKTSSVMRMIRALISASSPYEIIKGGKPYDSVVKRYEQINRKYQNLLKRAKRFGHGKILFFKYSGDLSISAELSNELMYSFPHKLIVVAYIKGEVVKISLRGGKKDLRVIASNILKEIKGKGGGHERAVGMAISLNDLDKLKKLLEEQA